MDIMAIAGMEPTLGAGGGGEGKVRLPIAGQNLAQTHFLGPGLSSKHPVKTERSF